MKPNKVFKSEMFGNKWFFCVEVKGLQECGPFNTKKEAEEFLARLIKKNRRKKNIAVC